MACEKENNERIQAVVFSSSLSKMSRPKLEFNVSYGDIGELSTKLNQIMINHPRGSMTSTKSMIDGCQRSVSFYDDENIEEERRDSGSSERRHERRPCRSSLPHDDDDHGVSEDEHRKDGPKKKNPARNDRFIPNTLNAKAVKHCIVDLDEAHDRYWTYGTVSSPSPLAYGDMSSADFSDISSTVESSWQFRAAF